MHAIVLTFITTQLVLRWLSGAGDEGETLQDRAGGSCSSGSTWSSFHWMTRMRMEMIKKMSKE